MQPCVLPLPKDRGAEQGDVDGPLECALTLGQVAKEAATKVHQLQRNGGLEWANTQADLAASQGPTQLSRAEAIKEAQEAFDNMIIAECEWAASLPEDRRAGGEGAIITPNPGHEIQKNGGLADLWYVDDGDTVCPGPGRGLS